MSTQPRSHDDEVVELTIRLRHLLVTVRGSPERASEALSLITGSPAGLGPPVAESENSFEVVSSAGDSVASGRSRVLESRDQIASTFATCPASWLSRASRLGGSVSARQSRIRRAWQAGQRARAVLDQTAFPPIDLSLWTCAAGSTWSFGVRAWIVLWCFGLLAATGPPWVLSPPAGVPIPSVIHSQASGKLVSTWTLLLLDSLNPTCFVTRDVCGKRSKCFDFSRIWCYRTKMLTWADGEAVDGHLEVKVLAVLRRNDGLLLAVPDGVLPQDQPDQTNQGMESGFLGPSRL